MSLIYLDNAATTAIHPSVREAMAPFLESSFGNPSSTHTAGRQVRKAVEYAREQVAIAIGADPADIIFTSGGTEADNAAIIGSAIANRDKGKHIVTTAIEHHAVLETCEFLEKMGYEVTYVAPRPNGIVSVDSVVAAIRPDTVLVSVMYVNNETGAVQPIAEISAACAEQDILFHSDAVQGVGLLPIDVKAANIQLLSISSHKLHGPKGVGALYVNRTATWSPLLHGGSQERKKRGGTENVPGIVGFGTAIERMAKLREENSQHIRMLRDKMLSTLQQEVPGIIVNSPEEAVPSILSVSFSGVSAETLLMNLDMQAIAASSGSACTSSSLLPSHVLAAMKIDPDCVKSAIRFSFSEDNTLEEVETAARKTAEIVTRLRKK